jgi:fatty-acyl-CoA synthase
MGEPEDGEPVMGFDEFLAGAAGVEEVRERQATLAAGDVINMQYTSGTTGFPKGVQLTHANIVKNAFYIGECMKLGPEDRVCIPVPFFHCFGCVLGTLNTVTHEGRWCPSSPSTPRWSSGPSTRSGAPRCSASRRCS